MIIGTNPLVGHNFSFTTFVWIQVSKFHVIIYLGFLGGESISIVSNYD